MQAAAYLDYLTKAIKGQKCEWPECGQTATSFSLMFLPTLEGLMGVSPLYYCSDHALAVLSADMVYSYQEQVPESG